MASCWLIGSELVLRGAPTGGAASGARKGCSGRACLCHVPSPHFHPPSPPPLSPAPPSPLCHVPAPLCHLPSPLCHAPSCHVPSAASISCAAPISCTPSDVFDASDGADLEIIAPFTSSCQPVSAKNWLCAEASSSWL